MLIRADARALPLRDGCVDCVVTSPPYWGLRDYGLGDNGIGLESSPQAYIASLLTAFREIYRVLKHDGTIWVNLADTFQNAKGQAHGIDPKQPARRHLRGVRPNDVSVPGLKPKDLVGVPWTFALALREAGWYLRADIVWAKGVSFCPTYVGSVMPEAVSDRPTISHEYVFLLSKSRRYYFDADAIKEPTGLALAEQVTQGYNGTATKAYDAAGVQNPSTVKARIIAGRRSQSHARGTGVNPKATTAVAGSRQNASFSAAVKDLVDMRNVRSVWTIPTEPYPGAHFATMPEALVTPCILAGCPLGGLVLDPFCGTGTVVSVAQRLGRRGVGVDLAYQDLAKKRTAQRGLRFEALT